MIYPIDPHCETQPRITVSDIKLKNVTSTGSLLPAGILRCNKTNPCKGFDFEDVNLHSRFWDFLHVGFISQYIEGYQNNTFPNPKFQPEGFFDDPRNLVFYEEQNLAEMTMMNVLFEQVMDIANLPNLIMEQDEY